MAIQLRTLCSLSLRIEAISATVRALRSRGHQVAGCAVLTGSAKPVPELEKILASHTLIHTAEGAMFRDVLIWAAKECALPVTAIGEKTLDAVALERIGTLGKGIGPPWAQDQKLAALAALMALGNIPKVSEIGTN